MNKIFTSSVDRDKMSLTFKALIPTVILVVGLFGVTLTGADLGEIVDSFMGMMAAVGAAMSAVIAFYGLVRKLLVKVGLMHPKA